MPVLPHVRLDPLSRIVAQGACWDDEYPAWQAFANELEKLCAFLKQAGQFERFLPRLQARKKERNSALNEIRVAFQLYFSGFPILDWAPSGQGRSAGEFLVGLQSGEQIFVEVKGPTWEAELSQEERLGGRTRQQKYINGEGRVFDNSEWIHFAIDKAYPKFSPDYSNLLVIADDLSVSLQHGTDMFAGKALYETRGGGYFVQSGYERLGGVAIFWNNVRDSHVAYDLKLYTNSYALDACRLPNEFIQVFGGRTL